MIINPFLEKDEIFYEKVGLDKSENKEINHHKIKMYLIENFMEYLKDENRELLSKEVQEYIYNNYNIKDVQVVNKVCDIIFNKMFGYGILQKYIDSQDISDIRVVKYNEVYVKKHSRWIKTEDSFNNTDELYEYIRYIILKNNKNINYEKPLTVVSDKKYRLRVEAGIFPINSISPSIVIRIHRVDNNLSLEKLAFKYNMMNYDIYNFLLNIINKNKSILISGKGGSGKTTLLRSIIEKISDSKAISINEETTELYIKGKNVIEREINNNIDLETLVKHSLVSSNDVIVVGEIKGSEASALLDSIATGHMGLATIHSNSSTQTINRLITLVKKDIKARDYKNEFITEIISNGLDYIIYMDDYKINSLDKLEFVEGKLETRNLYKLKKIKDDKFQYVYKFLRDDDL